MSQMTDEATHGVEGHVSDTLLLARRLLRLTAQSVLDDPLDEHQILMEQAVADCLKAVSAGSSCVELDPSSKDAAKMIEALKQEVAKGDSGICSCELDDGPNVPLYLECPADGADASGPCYLYLRRQALDEQAVARQLRGMLVPLGEGLDAGRIADIVGGLMGWTVPDAEGLPHERRLGVQQTRAVARMVAGLLSQSSRLMVLTGGPGTGKTTTVVRMLAAAARLKAQLLDGDVDCDGSVPLVVRLVAPTGKAAARLRESIDAGRGELPEDYRELLKHLDLHPTTLARLLGKRFSALESYRHGAASPLTGDIFVVDEVSMVSLPLMRRFLEALPARAAVVLVGDPEQLTSVECGTVLADIVKGLRRRSADTEPSVGIRQLDGLLRKDWEKLPSVAADTDAGGADWDGGAAGQVARLAAWACGLVELDEAHRSKGQVAELVTSIREIGRGETGTTQDEQLKNLWALLSPKGEDVRRVECLDEAGVGELGADCLSRLVEHYARLEKDVLQDMDTTDAEERGEALAEQHRRLSTFVLLCANRQGTWGSTELNRRIASAIRRHNGTNDVDVYGERIGSPVMVTRNYRDLNLSNGDIALVVRHGGSVQLCVPSVVGGVRFVARDLVEGVEQAYAITIHKSQGSEYDEVIVQMGREGSGLGTSGDNRLNTRELLYTAVSRAKHRVTVVGSWETVAKTVSRDIERASRLDARLQDASLLECSFQIAAS